MSYTFNILKMKKIFSYILIFILGLSFSACSGDDDNSNSQLIGTWTMQVQWAGTDGTRDHSYTFESNGTGIFKAWNWLDQKYEYQNFKWSATETVLSLNMEPLPDGDGYLSGIRYYTVTPTCLTLYYQDGDFDGNYFKE